MRYEELLKVYPAVEPWLRYLPTKLKNAYYTQKIPAHAIFHQKDGDLRKIGILCEETLRILSTIDCGDVYMIEYDHAVDFIGDVAALTEELRSSVTIEAYTACVVICFSREDFDWWLQQSPEFLRLMAKNVAQKLYHSSYRRCEEMFYSSPHKVMFFLVREMQGITETTRFLETRQSIAEQLGMNQKTLDRTIRKLKDIGMLSIDRGKISISPEQLRMMQKALTSAD